MAGEARTPDDARAPEDAANSEEMKQWSAMLKAN